MHATRHLTLASLILAVVLGAACSSDDAAAPDGDVACADREAVPIPAETGPVGTIRTWAGGERVGYDGDCNALLESRLYWPVDIEFTPNVGTYIVDWNNHRIRRVTSRGRLETVVGTNSVGDGPPDQSDRVAPGALGTSCLLNHPTEVFERGSGTLLIVAWHNHKLREWDPVTRRVLVTAGDEPGCTGDGGVAADAALNQACHAVEATDGSLYIVDQRNQCIRRIDPSGIVSTVVATPACSFHDPGGFAGDGGDPKLAKMSQPTGSNPSEPGGGIALDAQGLLYFADTNNQRIRRVDFVANVIQTVVGNGTAAYAGDDGDPRAASLHKPIDIEFGPDGRLYIADAGNNVIRAVDFASNTITTVAGTGAYGFGGDGGPATSAQLANPLGIGFDADGHLYIADTDNSRIRRVKMHD
jgi:hypothetical protein